MSQQGAQLVRSEQHERRPRDQDHKPRVERNDCLRDVYHFDDESRRAIGRVEQGFQIKQLLTRLGVEIGHLAFFWKGAENTRAQGRRKGRRPGRLEKLNRVFGVCCQQVG